MKWSLTGLQSYQDEPLRVCGVFDLNAQLVSRFPEKVLASSLVNVDGYLSYDKGDAILEVRVSLDLTVPSSRSLAPVELPLDFSVLEVYLPEESHRVRYEDGDWTVITLGSEQVIDLDEILVENIIVQVPLKVLTKEERDADRFPSGEDWAVIGEFSSSDQRRPDSPFNKLRDLFPQPDSDNFD